MNCHLDSHPITELHKLHLTGHVCISIYVYMHDHVAYQHLEVSSMFGKVGISCKSCEYAMLSCMHKVLLGEKAILLAGNFGCGVW